LGLDVLVEGSRRLIFDIDEGLIVLHNVMLLIQLVRNVDLGLGVRIII
jgi:hypothetical protein